MIENHFSNLQLYWINDRIPHFVQKTDQQDICTNCISSDVTSQIQTYASRNLYVQPKTYVM